MYVLVPEAVYTDRSLSHGDIRVYIWLRSFDLPMKDGKRKNYVFVSTQAIHEKFGMDASQINRHIRRLDAAGHITIERRNRKAPIIRFTSGNATSPRTAVMESPGHQVQITEMRSPRLPGRDTDGREKDKLSSENETQEDKMSSEKSGREDKMSQVTGQNVLSRTENLPEKPRDADDLEARESSEHQEHNIKKYSSPSARERPKPKKSKKTTSPHAPAMKTYMVNTWQARFNTKYHFQGAKDGMAIKRLLGTFEFEEICQRWDMYLADNDPFIAKHGHGIAFFQQRVNAYQPQQETGWKPSSTKLEDIT